MWAIGDNRNWIGNYHVTGIPESDHELPKHGCCCWLHRSAIVDTDNPEKELAFGERGEIALRGPSIAKGYWNIPDATAAVFRQDGWFLTGDIGYLDEVGVPYIIDRKKDMIIMPGWKIYPTEVENVIIQHPAIADVAVFGIPDERKGEVPVAAVVFKSGTSITPSEIESYCRVHLAGYKILRSMKVFSSDSQGCMGGNCYAEPCVNHSVHSPSTVKKT